MASIIYKGKQEVVSGSYLFEDKCNSETLPSGVTTNQPIFYDSVNQIRYFTADTSRYILPDLGAIQDKAICISGHIKTDATKKNFLRWDHR